MAAYTSTQNGEWNEPATWGGGGYPDTNGDTATITHTVTYSISADVELGQININSGGTLSFNPSANTYMEIQNNTFIYVNDEGALTMGTSANPVPKEYTAELAFNCSSDNTAGIITTNYARVNMYGDPDYFGSDKETYLANNCTGTTSITATDDMSSKWNVGDEIAIDKHENYTNWTTAGIGTTITGFGAGNVIHVADVISSDYNKNGIIVHLTRNVRFHKAGFDRSWYGINTGRIRLYFTNHTIYPKNFCAVSFAGFYYYYSLHMNFFINPDGIFNWNVIRNGRQGDYSCENMKRDNCIYYSLQTAGMSSCSSGRVWDCICMVSQRLSYSNLHLNIKNTYCYSCNYALYSTGNSIVHNLRSYSGVYDVYACYNTTISDSYSGYSLYGDDYNFLTKFVNYSKGFDHDDNEIPNQNHWRHSYGNPQYINCKFSPSGIFNDYEHSESSISSGISDMRVENFNQIQGDNRVYSTFGYSRNIDADGQSDRPTQRVGGSSRVMEIQTRDWCGDGSAWISYPENNYQPGTHTFKAFEHQIWSTANIEKTIRYYIQTDYTFDLTSDMLCLGVTPLYVPGSIMSDETISTRANQSDWSNYVEVTTTPSEDGWIRLEMIVFTYEENKKIWIDPKPEIIF